tara:strand:- start:100 stop:690 length:591 start_codon:yes stop_codon:yes gene_type:complete
MDGKMKGMIMAGMAGLCLILGIMGALGTTWLVDSEADEDAPESGYSLTAIHVDAEEAAQCDAMAGFLGGECDGADYSYAFSDACEETEDDDACDMATGGMIGTIGMWAGIICALMVTLSLVLPMAGVDAMDAVPEMGNKIATWGAGALMLVGMLGWYMMLPDGGDMSLGMSGWMAGAAMSMGLGSALIGQFIEADE